MVESQFEKRVTHGYSAAMYPIFFTVVDAWRAFRGRDHEIARTDKEGTTITFIAKYSSGSDPIFCFVLHLKIPRSNPAVMQLKVTVNSEKVTDFEAFCKVHPDVERIWTSLQPVIEDEREERARSGALERFKL